MKFLVCFLTLLGLACRAKTDRPNIIVILTDDMDSRTSDASVKSAPQPRQIGQKRLAFHRVLQPARCWPTGPL